uniref:Uncharacterized protein n=1 Tax=Arundo donax TaxID=35708 RepID=A0A0A8YZN3_ARUDO
MTTSIHHPMVHRGLHFGSVHPKIGLHPICRSVIQPYIDMAS